MSLKWPRECDSSLHPNPRFRGGVRGGNEVGGVKATQETRDEDKRSLRNHR